MNAVSALQEPQQQQQQKQEQHPQQPQQPQQPQEQTEHQQVTLQYMPSSVYEAKRPPTQDPFRHESFANSHNHHALHPWGPNVAVGSPEFDARYAEENNRYMYHLWYSDKLAPYMATEIITIQTVSNEMLQHLTVVIRSLLKNGVDAALKLPEAEKIRKAIQRILDDNGLKPNDKIFVRLGATSAKDSFALDAPTTKPSPLTPNPDLILRRLLTSGRCVGRILVLSENVWKADPGEALIIQRWSPAIDLRYEFRVFIYQGKVNAISQDIWWEKLGWRDGYSSGIVDTIVTLWSNVKGFLPFDTCTMDVFLSKDERSHTNWKAGIIEFNGFGAHLNTGSDLFHWVNDADILTGKRKDIVVRFVDDWEDGSPVETIEKLQPRDTVEEGDKVDWFALEAKIRANYSEEAEDFTARKGKLPLKGRWCSAY